MTQHERMDVIYFQWRIVSDTSPWNRKPGNLLIWRMTEWQAAEWQSNNPQTVLEQVEGSDVTNDKMGNTSDPR